MPPRRHRSSGVDTVDDIRRKISQQQAAITREFGSLEICTYLYNQWTSKAPRQKADNAKRGYLARKSQLNLQNKLNKRIREEDEEANRRNEALGNLSPQSIWADPIRLPLRRHGVGVFSIPKFSLRLALPIQTCNCNYILSVKSVEGFCLHEVGYVRCQ